MTEQKPTELATYQHVDGVLRRVPADEVTALRGAVYFAPAEGDHEQAGDPVICPACAGGWHGDHCRQEFWTTTTPPELVECDCTEGACKGEWVPIGATEAPGPEWVGVGPATVTLGPKELPVAASRVWIAPVGTALPTASAQPFDEGGPIGPPIKVHRVEREDGTYVEGYLGPAHPAYAAVRAGLTTSLSIGNGPAEHLTDNGPYVNPIPPGGIPATDRPNVTVASPTVNGLGREQLDNHRHIPKPAAIGLGDIVAGLFGAELTGDPDEPVREITRVVPNRADRRRAQRQARRGH